MNYRLGALGWLGGDKFIDDGGMANGGLWDQKLAMEWVQQNIWLFGGDSRR
jgi:carboxylesterase type B